ncbi:MAG: transposase [Candidatus Nitrosocosmicus sp.]
MIALKDDWNFLVEDESIFVHDSHVRRKWIVRQKRPIVTVTGPHSKTIIFGVLSNDGKQLFRQQYDKFNGHSFIRYLEKIRKKFKKFVIFVYRATQHRSKLVQQYLQINRDNVKIEYFPVGSPEFNAVEECWRQGKYNILSDYYPNFQSLKHMIARYYRTRRFNLDIKKYLSRSTN